MNTLANNIVTVALITRITIYDAYLNTKVSVVTTVTIIFLPLSVAVRSKMWVCGRSPAEIVGSNPIGRHGDLSFVIIVCCQVEVSATDLSLVQRSPTDCGASLCVIKKPRKRRG